MRTNIPEHERFVQLGHSGCTPKPRFLAVYGLVLKPITSPVSLPCHLTQARGKTANYSNSFLPGAYSGCGINSMHPDRIVSDLKNQYLSRGSHREQADLLAQLNQIDLRNQE